MTDYIEIAKEIANFAIENYNFDLDYFICTFFVSFGLFTIKELLLSKALDNLSGFSFFKKKGLGLLIETLIAQVINVCGGMLLKNTNIFIVIVISFISTICLEEYVPVLKKIIHKPNTEEIPNEEESKTTEVTEKIIDERGQIISLPKNKTIEVLDILDILEMYGYISVNQKFKMIIETIDGDSDNQVKALLDMKVLDEEELHEARAILNLIKLEHRLLTRTEVLNYLLNLKKEQESKKIFQSSNLTDRKAGRIR